MEIAVIEWEGTYRRTPVDGTQEQMRLMLIYFPCTAMPLGMRFIVVTAAGLRFSILAISNFADLAIYPEILRVQQ